VKSLSNDDFWSRWFRKKSKRPITKKDSSEEMDEIINKIEELLDNKFRELSDKALNEQKKRKPIPGEEKKKRFGHFIYGYSITLGPDGEPRIRQLGNFEPKMCPKKPKYNERRDLLVDVIPTDKEIQVVMELPGVSKKDIKITSSQEQITVVVDTLKFNYYEKIPMPCIIDPKSVKTEYINGVLKIYANKADKIKIE